MIGGLINALIITLMMQFLAQPLGIRGLFYIGAFFILVSIIQIVNFDERIDIERLDAKGLIVWGKPIKRMQKPALDIEIQTIDEEDSSVSVSTLSMQDLKQHLL